MGIENLLHGMADGVFLSLDPLGALYSLYSGNPHTMGAKGLNRFDEFKLQNVEYDSTEYKIGKVIGATVFSAAIYGLPAFKGHYFPIVQVFTAPAYNLLEKTGRYLENMKSKTPEKNQK